jgi:hypothetical protein
MRNAIVFLLLASACRSTTTAEFIQRQQGFREMVTGYPISITMDDPKVEQLENGVAYTITNDRSKVLMEFDERVPGTLRNTRRNYDLKAGDIFIKSRPFSYLLIKG